MTVTEGVLASSEHHEMSRDDCLERLRSTTMGRIAWTAGGVQQILPVSYVMHAGSVVFRTSPYGALAGLQRRTHVAFEIDQIDAVAETGWSVVVHGRAEAVVLPQELVMLSARSDIVPWASGSRNLFISIEPQAISGRVVRAPFAD